MSIYTDAIYESLSLDEDKSLNESYWDNIKAYAGNEIEEAGLEEELQEDMIEDDVEQDIDEPIMNESLSNILEEYDSLLKEGVDSTEARKQILAKQPKKVVESKKLSREERLAEAKKSRMRKYTEEFRKAANFSLDEELDEDKLKRHEMLLKNHAIKHGIPSKDLREALIKGIN